MGVPVRGQDLLYGAALPRWSRHGPHHGGQSRHDDPCLRCARSRCPNRAPERSCCSHVDARLREEHARPRQKARRARLLGIHRRRRPGGGADRRAGVCGGV